jgi:hypothetical protein
MERPCSIGIGSNIAYLIPPPPPPIDAQLGRIPVAHAIATMVIHLTVRRIMSMKSSIPDTSVDSGRSMRAGDGRWGDPRPPRNANRGVIAAIPSVSVEGSRDRLRRRLRMLCRRGVQVATLTAITGYGRADWCRTWHGSRVRRCAAWRRGGAQAKKHEISHELRIQRGGKLLITRKSLSNSNQGRRGQIRLPVDPYPGQPRASWNRGSGTPVRPC